MPGPGDIRGGPGRGGGGCKPGDGGRPDAEDLPTDLDAMVAICPERREILDAAKVWKAT